MSTNPVISETSVRPQERYKVTPAAAAEASLKGVEAKRLKKKDPADLIRTVLIRTLTKGKPSDQLRAALELNRDLGVMRGEQREAVDSGLDKGAELLSSTAPDATNYLTSDQVARIRAIGGDNGSTGDRLSPVVGSDAGSSLHGHQDAIRLAVDHPSSQEAGPVQVRVTEPPKFFSASDLPTRLDAIDTRLNQLTAAVDKLTQLCQRAADTTG